MSKQRYYQWLFRAAAIWSWVVSLAYFIGDSVDEPFLRRQLPAVQPRVMLDMAVLPPFLFGFAFWWLARDLRRNHAIAGVGAAGCVLAFVSFAIRAWRAELSPDLVAVATVDLCFGLLILEFLIWVNKDASRAV